MPENQKLALEVTQTGAVETAAAIGKVETAQKQVAGTAVQSAAATDVATEATKKATASNEDLFNILNKIHPGLGEIAQTMSRGSKVAGDFATKNIDLGKSFSAVTGFIKGNIAALGLLAAGAAVAFAINRITEALAKEREEMAKAAEEAKRYEQALADLNKQRGQQQQTIEEIAGQRKGGGFKSAEESRAAQQQAERVRARFPQLSESSVNTVLGNLGDAGLSDEEVTRAAFAAQQNRLKFDASKSTQQNLANTRGTLRNNRSQIDRAISLENQQKVEAARVVTSAGNRDGIQDVEAIKAAIEQTGLAEKIENVDLLARALANRGAIAGDDSEVTTHTGPFGTSRRVTKTNEFADAETLQGRGFTESLSDLAAASRHIETIAQAAERIIQNGAQSGTTHIAHQVNIGPDAAARKRVERNGASAINAAR